MLLKILIIKSNLMLERYDRETCVFTPPKHSAMSVYTSSLANHADVLTALLAKYKVENKAPFIFESYL